MGVFGMSSAVSQHQHAPDCDQDSRVTRRTLDPSSRYADVSLDEATLIKRLGLDQCGHTSIQTLRCRSRAADPVAVQSFRW